MRKILFRGKQFDGEWVFGIYLDENHIGIFYDDTETEDCRIDIFQIIPETMGRYTGLNDKNGNKIFEGDIIKTKYGRLCMVMWFSSPTFIGFDLVPIEGKSPAPTQWDLYESTNLEVIRNIHDKPELLNAERNDEDG